LTVSLPERVYAMDCKYPVLTVACADRRVYIFNCDAPDKPIRVMESPLKLQTRCVRVFHNRHFFLLGSAEGRATVRCVDEARDAE
jgi:mRNA export factor